MNSKIKIEKYNGAAINRNKVFNLIWQNGPINRAAIAKQTGLTIPSIMSITDGLIEYNLIQPVGKGKSTGGKRPELLNTVPDRYFFVGVDVGRFNIKIAITNFRKEVIYKASFATENTYPERDFVVHLSNLICNAVSASGIDQEHIAGIGVAMPGLIERETGYAIFSPDFEWSDIPLEQWLNERLPWATLVENSSRALALAESDYFKYTGAGNNKYMIVVNLGYGIGSAMISPNGLYYGASGTSGELGHITVEKDGQICACGNNGCLEAMASGAAIARQAQNVINNRLPSSLTELCGGDPKNIDAKMVFDAAKGGDKLATSIVDKACEYIGIGISDSINLLDPGKIVLCGGLTKNGDFFLDRVRKSIDKHKMRMAGGNVELEVDQIGEYATAIGATYCIAFHPSKFPNFVPFCDDNTPMNNLIMTSYI